MLRDTQLLTLLDYLFVGGTPPDVLPVAMHLGLHVGGSPPNGADGSDFVEPSAPEYGRIEINNTTFWSPAYVQVTGPLSGFVVKESLGTLQFEEALSPWGTPTYVGLFDAATGGNARATGLVTQTVSIGTGFQVRFPPGAVNLVARRP